MQEISLAGNPELFCEVDGWIAPVRGRGKRPTDALNWAKSEARRLSRVYAFCEQRRTVIQAGGNVGVFPAKLAPVFQRVITVEPDARNYVALVANTAHLVNVESYRAAFGAESSTASVHQIDPGNSGTCSIVDGSDFPVYPIDALGVQDCDLLLLDVEGYELFALQGAIETIQRSWPVIVVEVLEEHLNRHGSTVKMVTSFLEQLGYTRQTDVGYDSIFKIQ